MAYKLLLADDSVTIQKVVELTFSDEDFQIMAVGDGNAAYEKIKATNPDIILSDVIMPGLNGYDLCAKVKQDPQLERIPFLFLKGTFESFDEERAASVGSQGFIVKPFESQELISRVKELVEKARQTLVAQAAAAPPISAAPIPAPPSPAARIPEQEEEPGLGEFAEEAAPGATVAGLESFDSVFTGIGESVAEPAASEETSEEDLWSEVKISDHPIPPSTARIPAPEIPVETEFVTADQTMLEEVSPIAATAWTAPPAPPVVQAPPEPAWTAAPAPPAAAPAALAIPTVTAEAIERILASRLEEVIREIAPDIIREVTRRVISDVVWEVVPETAEKLIRKEIDRITGGTTR